MPSKRPVEMKGGLMITHKKTVVQDRKLVFLFSFGIQAISPFLFFLHMQLSITYICGLDADENLTV